MTPWKRVGIAIKDGAGHECAELVRTACAQIEAAGCELVLAAGAAAEISGSTGHALEAVAERVDLLVVMGGDGTMLRAARAIGARDVALFGVNLGRVGFLTEVPPERAEEGVAAVLAGEHRIETRGRLAVTPHCRGEDQPTRLVTNDAVISSHEDVARMLDLETSLAGLRMGSFRADGLIVSTPTGSTAYNLGAGGAILEPDVEAMIVTPICPLATSNQRPIVLSDRRVVEVRLHSDRPAQLTLDGQVALSLEQGDSVRVTRASHPLHFARLRDYDAFGVLRTKLHWGAS